MHVIGEIEGRNCVIMDDMIDTAGTLVKAADVLKERGAKKVFAYCTHAVFSGPAIERIQSSKLDEVVVTDTIPLADERQECGKVRQLSVAFLFAETIRRISDGESVTSSSPSRTVTFDRTAGSLFRSALPDAGLRPVVHEAPGRGPSSFGVVMKFTAYERTVQGTGASRRLRNAQKVPGIVYGAGTPAMIELDHNALFFALKKEAFHSSLLDMELGGKTEQVLLRDYQMHPFRPIVMHIDFQRVDAHHQGHQESAAALSSTRRTRRR
jgi:ribosomal protein L25 (general stress protein Ctc)